MISGYVKEVKFTQEPDCCGGDGICNLLSVEICDGGGGPFLVLKTERWAIDRPEELAEMLAHCLEQYKATQAKYPEVSAEADVQ